MQSGIVKEKYACTRYTYIALEDGRTIKGKWNPAWHVQVGDEIKWTTYGSWNPHEWYNSVIVQPKAQPVPTDNGRGVISGTVIDNGYEGRGRKFTVIEKGLLGKRRTLVVHPHDKTTNLSSLAKAARDSETVTVEYYKQRNWPIPTVKAVY